MSNALLIGLLMTVTAAHAEAPVRVKARSKAILAAKAAAAGTMGPRGWIDFNSVRERTSFACNAMLGELSDLAKPKGLGTRKDGLNVGRELAIPREVVATMLNNAPPVPPAPTPNVAQRFLSRIRAFLQPQPAPTPASPEMTVMVDDVKAPGITPASRAIFEQVAARMETLQDESASALKTAYAARHVSRGRLKIRKYVTGLAQQTEILERHLQAEVTRENVKMTSLAEIEAMVTPEALALFKQSEAPPVESRFDDLKTNLKIGAWAGVVGAAWVVNTMVSVHFAIPFDVILGGASYYLSQTVRDRVGEIIGSVKSWYRDLRKPPAAAPVPTRAQELETELARVQVQRRVYEDIAEQLADKKPGKKPKQAFTYYSYEARVTDPSAPTGWTSQLVEHILSMDGKNFSMFTAISKLDSSGVSFTRVAL